MLTSKAGQPIGFASYHGWDKQGIIKKEVRPKVNQDRVFVTPKLCKSDSTWLFSVYDGNGPKGQFVAHEAAAEMVSFIEKHKYNVSESKLVPEVLSQAFEQINQDVSARSFSEKSGCTATVACLQNLKTLYVANVGNTKAVLGRGTSNSWKGTVLTADHKPGSHDEKKRIEEFGGFVLEDDDYGIARVFDTPDPIGQMMRIEEDSHHGGIGVAPQPWPGLALSRVIGHTGVANIGIVPTPTVSTFELGDEDRVLIIATDGIWNFIKPNEAVAMCKSHAPDAHLACKLLCEMAGKRWLEDDPHYRDDISCIVVFLPLHATIASSIDHEISTQADDAAAIKAAIDQVGPSRPASRRPSADRSVEVDANGIKLTEIGMGGQVKPSMLDLEAAFRDKALKKTVLRPSKKQRRGSVVTKFGADAQQQL